MCSTKKLCENENCQICFKRSFANFHNKEKLKCWSSKNIGTPRNYHLSSEYKAIFDCDKCNHEFQAQLNEVTRKNRTQHWCPYCAHNLLCENNDCEFCLKNSFASHKMSKKIVDKNINPRMIFKSSRTTFLDFKCDNCSHIYNACVSNVTRENRPSGGCPYCSKRSKKTCQDDRCEFCFKKSFASCPRADCVVDKKIDLRKIKLHSSIVLEFKCPDCKHNFKKTACDVARGGWCKYCCHQELCEDKDCEFCFNSSFASCNRAKYIADKEIDLRMIFKNSAKKLDFICEKGHNFTKQPSEINRKGKNGWCPKCRHKTEQMLYDWLVKNYKNIKHSARFPWCKSLKNNRHYYVYDFVIVNKKIIIELDGDQHFGQVSNWRIDEDMHKVDVYKMEKATENGYTIIRILQQDVYNDRNNWENKLKKFIEKKYDEPSFVYIGNSYKNFIDD